MSNKITTEITEKLGIEYPIIQGCMQWIARAPLVAAVSNAGGLGIISSSTFRDKEALREEIRAAKALTNKHFAVNLTLMPSLVVPDYMGYIQVCAEENVKIIETAGRPPKDDMLAAIKAAGITLMHKCTTVKHALKAQSIGADIVIADGCECAGHPGENDITTMVLTPAVVEALDIPVLPSVKEHLAKNATEMDTCVLLRSFKNSTRMYYSPVAQIVLDNEANKCKFEDIREYVAGSTACKMFFENGDVDGTGVICLGETIGLINEVLSCEEIITSMMDECISTMKKFN